MVPKSRKWVKWVAWVTLTLSIVIILRAIVWDNTGPIVNGCVWFVSAWMASHLTNDNVW
jgi:hypothetical protein